MRGDGDNKTWSPGRARISRKPLAQGKPVVSARTCGSAAFFFAARGPWVRRAPGLPCALFPMRVDRWTNSDANAPRERDFMSLSVVMPAHAGIQYAVAFRFKHCVLWNTGSPDQVGRRRQPEARFSPCRPCSRGRPSPTIRTPMLTIFCHCGFRRFSSRTTAERRAGNQPSTVLPEDFAPKGSGNADSQRKVRDWGRGGGGRRSFASGCVPAHPA
jgi:hypothetical protein